MGGKSLLVVVVVAACGGPQIPTHNGYKSPQAKPWKKSKPLKYSDDKMEAKANGDLSYPDMRRAAWYDIVLGTIADVDLKIEITPGDNVADNFDLGVEVLDAGNRPVMRKDLEEGDQTSELNKTMTLKDLAPGHYFLHLYLQGRLDTAEYVIHSTLHPTAEVAHKSDFPAQVAFVGPLPQVPITDDTPKNYHPPVTTAVVTHTTHKAAPPPKKDPVPPPVTTISARIISMSVVAGGTQITVGRGTSAGAAVGMKGKITGVPNGAFTLANCTERACTATVAATPDQIKGSGNVVLTP